MVPSALRTLSVVTLLSAVSGTVFLMTDHGAGSAAKSTTLSDSITGGAASGSVASSALAARSIPGQPAGITAHQAQRRAVAAEHQARSEQAAAKGAALARAEAKVKARAAAERRRGQIRQKASRSARRDPQALARIMVAERGWGGGQFSCLRSLWTRESGWNYRAMNPSSGAYGIPQSLPGGKMASAGSDWRTNPATQITWGLDYIADRYRTPCGAWAHSESSGWY